MKKAMYVYKFPNGMVAVCGKDDQQIPELQGRYTKELHQKIIDNSTPETIWKGF